VRKFLSLLFSSALLAASLTALSSASAVAETTLVTCTDLVTPNTVILRVNQKSCKPLDAPAIWHIQQSDSSARSGAGYANLRTCTSKRAEFSYQLLKSKCAKYQNTNDYWRTVAPPEIPIITTASARGYDSAAFALTATTQNIDAPIAYYLITNIKTGQINKVSPNNSGELSLTNLSSLTSYTFTIAAVSVDGTSPSSSITPVITTGHVPVVEVAPTTAPIAAPAFTLSSSSETKTVNNAIAGYTIDASAGGTIASYSISPAAPAGLTFSTSTGAITGTPTTVASATAFTITATNASGSATRTFTLTVDMAFQSTLSITSLTTNTKAYPYSQAVSITSSGGSGLGATTYAIASGGSASGCTLTGPTATETITATTSGTCLIQASKAADSIYSLATSATSIFTFTKAIPILSNSMTWFDILLGKNSDDAPFDLGTPTIANNLVGTFTFTSSATGVATISGRTVTIVSGGDTFITATFTPTDTTNYSSDSSIQMKIHVDQILLIG
jgi:hypothetical protein